MEQWAPTFGKHSAGSDLTNALEGAPHGPEVFEKVRYVGDISEKQPTTQKNLLHPQNFHYYGIREPGYYFSDTCLHQYMAMGFSGEIDP